MAELRFVPGGHGAAIAESFWPEIAAFVLQGKVPARPSVARSAGLTVLYRCAPAVTVCGLVFAAALLLLPLIVTAALALSMEPGLVGAGLAVGAVGASLAVSWLCGRFLRAW